VSKLAAFHGGREIPELKPLVAWDSSTEVVFAVSRDRRRLMTATRSSSQELSEVWLWDLATGKVLAGPLRISRPTEQALFTEDGRLLAAGGRSGLTYGDHFQLFDAATGKPHALPDFKGRIMGVRPDGTVLADTIECVVQLCDGFTDRPVGPPVRLPDRSQVPPLASTPDGRLLLAVKGREVERWQIVTGQSAGPSLIHGEEVRRLLVSPDGRLLVSVSGKPPERVHLWDLAEGKEIGQPRSHPARIGEMIFRSDSGAVAITSGHHVGLWDAHTGDRLGDALEHPFPVREAQFSPDGSVLLTRNGPGSTGAAPQNQASEVRLFDARTGQLLVSPLPHAGPVRRIVFSADSRRLATLGDRNLCLWSLPDGGRIGEPLTLGPAPLAAFSPDGGMMVAGWDSTETGAGGFEWLDARTGARLGTVGTPLGVRALAFSPDGGVLATGHGQLDRQAVERGETRFWDVRLRRPLGAPLSAPIPVEQLAFSPDGRTLLAATPPRLGRLGLFRPAEARLWPVPQRLAGQPEDLHWWAEIFTGLRLDADGRVHVLGPGEWEESRRRWQRAGGP
jgi:WD40 repeat protein